MCMPKNKKLSTNSTIVPFIRNMGNITLFCGIWNTMAFVLRLTIIYLFLVIQ